MKKYSYIGISFVILIFGIIFFPKIMDRIDSKSISQTTRLAKSDDLSFIKLNGEKRKVPEFLFLNQDSLLISSEDFIGKVFVVEFFFTRCPSICIEMNKNMKILDEIYGDREDFGIASFTIDPEHDSPTTLKKYSELIEAKIKKLNLNKIRTFTYSPNPEILTGEIEILKVSPGEKIAVFHGSSTDVYVTEMGA